MRFCFLYKFCGECGSFVLLRRQSTWFCSSSIQPSETTVEKSVLFQSLCSAIICVLCVCHPVASLRLGWNSLLAPFSTFLIGCSEPDSCMNSLGISPEIYKQLMKSLSQISPSPWFPLYVFSLSGQIAGPSFILLRHILSYMILCSGPRKRPRREKKQQGFIPPSWYHNYFEWKISHLKALDICGLCCHCQRSLPIRAWSNIGFSWSSLCPCWCLLLSSQLHWEQAREY